MFKPQIRSKQAQQLTTAADAIGQLVQYALNHRMNVHDRSTSHGAHPRGFVSIAKDSDVGPTAEDLRRIEEMNAPTWHRLSGG